MSINDAVNEILDYLFQGYIQHGGTGLFSINEIAQKHAINSAEIGRYLVNEGLVKHQQFRHNGFVASISIDGINKINPQFIEDHTSTVLSVLGTNGNEWNSMMEILDYDPKDFQIAHDLAHLLKNNDLIETQFHHNDIIVKLTVRGKMLYEERKASFF